MATPSPNKGNNDLMTLRRKTTTILKKIDDGDSLDRHEKDLVLLRNKFLDARKPLITSKMKEVMKEQMDHQLEELIIGMRKMMDKECERAKEKLDSSLEERIGKVSEDIVKNLDDIQKDIKRIDECLAKSLR